MELWHSEPAAKMQLNILRACAADPDSDRCGAEYALESRGPDKWEIVETRAPQSKPAPTVAPPKANGHTRTRAPAPRAAQSRPTTPPPQLPGAVVTALAEHALEKLVPVFPGILWAGKYTVLAGDPGLAKSVLTLDIASRLSRGGQVSPFDTQSFAPGNTLIVSSEDGIADTVKPRVMAAGGDQSRIKILSGILEPGGRLVHPDLSRHLADIAAAITQHEIRLLVLDPITSFFGRIDSNSQTDVRGVIDPFVKLLQDTGCALLGVLHLNKQTAQKALFRIGGSVAMVGSPRAAFGFTADDHGEEPDADRLLLPIKLNIGKKGPGYRLRIVDADVDGATYPRIEWRERSETTVDDALNTARPVRESAVSKATKIIVALLADGAEHPSTEVFEACEGFGKASVYEALRVSAHKRKANDGAMFYQRRGLHETTFDGEAPGACDS